MALKQFKPDSDHPNLVAIYDIESSDPRTMVTVQRKHADMFSGVVLDTNTGKVTNLLMRTEAAGTKIFVAGVNTQKRVERNLQNDATLLYTGFTGGLFAEERGERTQLQHARIPAYYDDGVIFYIMPLPEECPDGPKTLARDKEILISESLRNRLNKMSSAKRIMSELETIPMGRPELITEKNQRSYFQSQPER